MDKSRLYFRCAGISFSISADPVLLNKLYLYWSRTLCVCWQSSSDCTWNISVIEKPGGHEYVHIEYHSGNVLYENPYRGKIELINSFIRELITKLLLRNGYIWLHAAAFLINGNGILIAGKKGTGKTTNLLNALLGHGASFISNDQVALKYFDNEVFAVKWRPDIKVSPETLGFLNVRGVNTNNWRCVPDKYLIMPIAKQYASIDFDLLSTTRKQRIKPCHAVSCIRGVKTEYTPISTVIFLDEISMPVVEKLPSEMTLVQFHDMFESDNENIMPDDLNHWDKRIPYWQKRITGILANEEACESAANTLKKLSEKAQSYRLFCRADLDLISNLLYEV